MNYDIYQLNNEWHMAMHVCVCVCVCVCVGECLCAKNVSKASDLLEHDER